MEQTSVFSCTYSAPCNQEVLNIRRKYLPLEETKLEELKRLDRQVQNAGVTESLCIGIVGCLIFGLGLCLAMEVIGSAVWLGILLGLLGASLMLLAYPLHHRLYSKTMAQNRPRILELADELSKQV